MLGGLAVLRNQDSSASLVSPSAHILVGDERGNVFLETVSVAPSVIDELLRQKNVSGFGQGLDAGRDNNDVGDFWVLRRPREPD